MPVDVCVRPSVAIVGGGPAGLMAAEAAAGLGAAVDLYEARPSVGRKFLIAGRGGLNLTHAEPFEAFVSRYGAQAAVLRPMIERFGAAEIRQWARGLGVETFVGSSERVFPVDFKAGPLLRHWVHRLHGAGVNFHVRHRWRGFSEEGMSFDKPDGPTNVVHPAWVFALGGGSWPQLGSDGAWVPSMKNAGIAVEPLRPANCGFDVSWSEHMGTRFAGVPVKSVVARAVESDGTVHERAGEFVITGMGVEGSLVYALSSVLRRCLELTGEAELVLDLVPGRTAAQLEASLARPRGKRSLSEHLKRHAGIDGVKAALLREFTGAEALRDPTRTVEAMKALRIPLLRPRPLAEAISTAGGVRFDEVDEGLMVKRLPGVFCAGEMLDWEAPTGGYLLTACLATGLAAGTSAAAWCKASGPA
ncbi:MAG: TIGR03862 family flavoprotein [Betaproteobacteria bacterium]|nr:TIGR03862 family flavoprotein [Betaproteobacteria bacterium]